MQNDLWIIDVLRDIGDYAGNRGYNRLMAAMEIARDEFLKDVESRDTDVAPTRLSDSQEITRHQALMPLLKKIKH